MSTSNAASRIVWIDCEMTGLDPARDELCEIAALVTDSNLQVLGDGVDVVIKPSDEALAGMNDFVRTMHTNSGLLEELPGGTTLAQAEQAVMAYITEYIPEASKAPLAGNSIATDRTFLAAYTPTLDAYLHYRMIDVSSIKELAKRWYPRAYFQAPAKHGNHRALGDILDSIAELRYYRSAVFADPPGPSSEEAQRKAAQQNSGLEHLQQPDEPWLQACARTAQTD